METPVPDSVEKSFKDEGQLKGEGIPPVDISNTDATREELELLREKTSASEIEPEKVPLKEKS